MKDEVRVFLFLSSNLSVHMKMCMWIERTMILDKTHVLTLKLL